MTDSKIIPLKRGGMMESYGLPLVERKDEQERDEETEGITLGTSVRVPEHYFTDKPMHFSKDKDALRWTCPICGLREPRHLVNGWARLGCRCEWAEQERRETLALRQTVNAQLKALRCANTYTWLGVAEIGLEDRTFDTFEARKPLDEATARAMLRIANTDELTEEQWDFARGTSIKHAHSTVSRRAQQLRDGVRISNILLSGGFGTGKTHLAAAFLNFMREHGTPCLFCTAQGFFDAHYAADFARKERLVQMAGETPVLVIDDLDKLYIKAREDKEDEGRYQKLTLRSILDWRYRLRLPTILTTNEQEDLSHWLEGSTLDRLLGNCDVLPMNGASYRRFA